MSEEISTEDAPKRRGRPPKTAAIEPVNMASPEYDLRGDDEACLLVRLNRSHWIGEERFDPPHEMLISLDQFRIWDKTGMATLVGVVR